MIVLVTGAKGFVGKNLCAQLKNIKEGKARNYSPLMNDNTTIKIKPKGINTKTVSVPRIVVKIGIISSKYCRQYMYRTGNTKKIAKSFFAFSKNLSECFFAISAILL